MNDTEETKVSVQQFNQEFLQAIQNSPEGSLKEASAKSSRMIQKRLREIGFWRNILPPESVSDGDLHPALEHDNPRIIENLEADSPGAKSLPFNESPDTTFYRG